MTDEELQRIRDCVRPEDHAWCEQSGLSIFAHRAILLAEVDRLAARAGEIAAKEREACARVAEDETHHRVVHDQHGAPWSDGTATMKAIAAAIRKRGGDVSAVP